jgi:hypothetical protein
VAGAQGAVEKETLEDSLHAVPPEDKPKFEKLAPVTSASTALQGPAQCAASNST